MMQQIMVVGSLNMDLVFRINQWPTRGQTVMGRSYRTVPGGKGANQAVAAARQGVGTWMVGCVGQDDFGQSLLQSLRLANVHVDGVRTASAPTGVALVGVEPDGESRIVVISGANRAVTAHHVEDERRAMAEADWVLLQMEIPLAATVAAAKLAHHLGSKVMLNPAPVPARGLPDELLQHVDLLVPNRGEARQLTGQDDPERAAHALRARGVARVIVTMSGEGALLVDDEGTAHIEPFPVEMVDATAAGDAFIGALSAALSRGKPLRAAARYGAAAGALAVTQLGAQPSLPTLEAVEALLAEREGRPPPGYPEERVEPFTSTQGEALVLRPILPSDAAGLKQLFYALSPESVYRRFFMRRQQLSDNEARDLATVNYRDDLALVAVRADDPDQIVGVARFAPTDERAGAVEMAIVVADDFQNHGIGRALFARLAEAARDLGHHWMLVETQRDNQAMIHLAERAGYESRVEREGTLLRLWLDLRGDK